MKICISSIYSRDDLKKPFLGVTTVFIAVLGLMSNKKKKIHDKMQDKKTTSFVSFVLLGLKLIGPRQLIFVGMRPNSNSIEFQIK